MGLEDRFLLPIFSPYFPDVTEEKVTNMIEVPLFGALLMEYARSNLSASAALDIINDRVLIPLTAGEESDLSAIRALIDTGSVVNTRVLIAHRIADVLTLSTFQATGYQTRAEIKSKIGF